MLGLNKVIYLQLLIRLQFLGLNNDFSSLGTRRNDRLVTPASLGTRMSCKALTGTTE